MKASEAEWKPPVWLRNLRKVAVAEARCVAGAESPADRLRLAFELMSFALARLRAQAEARGSTVGELLIVYEEAASRLRARA
jgi:hypothetical protein